MTKSKKQNILKVVGAVGVGLLIFLIIQVLSFNNSNNGFSKTVETISYEEYQELINDKEDFILMYGSETCSFCIEFKPILSQGLKDAGNDIDAYYIDADSLDEADRTFIANYYNIEGTPTTLMIINGEYEDELNGKETQSAVTNFLNEFIEKTENK